jgi:hypothetical protein
MPRRPGVLTDAQIRQMIGRMSGSQRPDQPNIGPVGAPVPGFNTPVADRLLNRPVDPATGVQGPLNPGQVNNVLKELMRGSLGQYGLTERDIRRLYRGVNFNLRSLSDPYLMRMVRGLLDQGLNMKQIMRDPAFMDYRQNYQGMRETGEQNMATDLAWVEKFRNVARDSFNSLLLSNTMGATAAAAGGSGGGGGGGGGGGFRRFGGGGGGDGDSGFSSDYDVGRAANRKIDWWYPFVNQIAEASAGIKSNKELRDFILGIKATMGTDEPTLQKILDAVKARATPREISSFRDVWAKYGSATGGPQKFVNAAPELKEQLVGVGAELRGDLSTSEKREILARRKYGGPTNTDQMREIWNKLGLAQQVQVDPAVQQYIQNRPTITKASTERLTELTNKEKEGDLSEEEVAELQTLRDTKLALINQPLAEAGYSPTALRVQDILADAMPNAVTGPGGYTPKAVMMSAYNRKQRGFGKEIVNNKAALNRAIVLQTLATNLNPNEGPIETHRSVTLDSDLDWDIDLPDSVKPGGLPPRNLPGVGIDEGTATPENYIPRRNAPRIVSAAARRRAVLADADPINAMNPARLPYGARSTMYGIPDRSGQGPTNPNAARIGARVEPPPANIIDTIVNPKLPTGRRRQRAEEQPVRISQPGQKSYTNLLNPFKPSIPQAPRNYDVMNPSTTADVFNLPTTGGGGGTSAPTYSFQNGGYEQIVNDAITKEREKQAAAAAVQRIIGSAYKSASGGTSSPSSSRLPATPQAMPSRSSAADAAIRRIISGTPKWQQRPRGVNIPV